MRKNGAEVSFPASVSRTDSQFLCELETKIRKMSSSCSPAGILRPVPVLVLTVFLIASAGCTLPGAGPVSAPADPDSAPIAGNDTNTSVPSQESTRALQGFMARPSGPMDRAVSPAVPAIRTTGTFSYTGPTLAAKGGTEVNISEITIASETLDPER